MRTSVTVLALTAVLLVAAGPAWAKARPKTFSVDAEQDEIINRLHLVRLKRLILKHGKRCTYSSMYNNNPCYETSHFRFYLDPDPGGPHEHPQWNMNCDLNKGPLNTIVIQAKTTALTKHHAADSGYYRLRLRSKKRIQLEGVPRTGLAHARIWELLRSALREALAGRPHTPSARGLR